MATRVRLTADVDPEVKKQVRIAAIQCDTSVSEWVDRAVMRELAREEPGRMSEDGIVHPEPGARLQPLNNPPRLRDGSKMSDAAVEADSGWYREDMATTPPRGAKPKGSENPPKLRDGKLISDAVIEDRR